MTPQRFFVDHLISVRSYQVSPDFTGAPARIEAGVGVVVVTLGEKGALAVMAEGPHKEGERPGSDNERPIFWHERGARAVRFVPLPFVGLGKAHQYVALWWVDLGGCPYRCPDRCP